MSLGITITIHADEEGNFTPIETSILRAVALQGAASERGETVYNIQSPEGSSVEDVVRDSAQQVENAVRASAGEKPAEAPKRKRRTKAEIEADEAAKKAAEEAETPKADEDTAPSSESEDAAPVAEEPSTEPAGEPTGEAGKTGEDLVQEAVARAAKFMRDGRGPEAKAALDRVGNGAERVSKLNPKDVPAYMAALDELESL